MAILAKALQPAKTQAIEETRKVFSEYNDFIFTEYRGLTVAQVTALRHKLREHEAPFKVVKNNFAKIAFEELKINDVADYLTGPTAIVMVKEDSNEAAKVLFDFAKENEALVIKGGYIGNEVYDQAKIEAYSKVPGKKQLIAMLMSTINGPVQKLAATLQAYVDKKTAEGAN